MQPQADPTRTITFDVFSGAWTLLGRDRMTFAISMFIYVGLTYAVGLPVQVLMQGALMAQVQATQNPMAMLSSPLYYGQFGLQFVVGAVVMPIAINIARMALTLSRGGMINIGSLFEFEGKYGKLFIYSLMVSIIGQVGMFFCCIPGILFYALTMPGGLLVREQDMDPWAAIQLSIKQLMPSFGAALGIAIVCGICAIGGAILCVIPFFFMAPVYFCAQALMYEKLFGGAPAPSSWASGGYTPPGSYIPPSSATAPQAEPNPPMSTEQPAPPATEPSDTTSWNTGASSAPSDDPLATQPEAPAQPPIDPEPPTSPRAD